jgi:hypothetical protein
MKRVSTRDVVLAAAVLIHLAVAMVHGFAHSRANVMLPPSATLFVFGVILVGPVLGLVVQRLALPRGGAWLIAAAMAGALAFGFVNHFMIPGIDHVSHVAEPWRPLFGITAALLVATEAFGSAFAAWCAVRAR